MATRRPKVEVRLQSYGAPFKPFSEDPQLEYDMWAFANRTPVDRGVPPRSELFKRIAEKMMPGHFEWHDWTQKVVESLSEYTLVGIPGCSNSAKTFNVAGFASVWWNCWPTESSAMFVSTSRDSLRRRGWSEIQKCFSKLSSLNSDLNFVDSRMMWQCQKGDARHCIFGKAVEEGPVWKVADDIKGVHTRRQMVVIDEATAVPEAIFDAVSNLYSYPVEFILVVMGNPRNRLDQFGKFIEPKGGWTAITVEDDEWDGQPQSEYGGLVPHIIRFDAERSPNIVEGKTVSRHLPSPQKVQAQRNAAGGQTPLWWSNFRGFPPPEGLTKTVFSELSILANNGFGEFRFTGKDFMIIGAFDHARNGGDRPALRFAKLGEIESGKWGMQWMAPIVIPVNVNTKNPIDFQLAEQVKRQCESFAYKGYKYSCPPENLIVDATGEGAGFADILQRTWSADIVRVVFNWSASDDATSLEDVRPASEVYENRAVEMHFRARDALNHGQLRGIDRETAVELCTREFDDSGKRIKLQKKEDYRKKYRRSPDFGDTGAMLFELARKKGFRLVAVGATINHDREWQKEIQKTQAVYDGIDYAPEELVEV